MNLKSVTMNLVDVSSTVLVLRASLQASKPSLCGMFVYSEDMLIVIRMLSSSYFILLILCKKSVVSLTKLSRVFTSGLRLESTKAEMGSVGPPQAEMMGRPRLPCLCIFGSR